ncbi:MAG: phosphoglycerate kinase [Proteobacteria bacterium]|nr:phosphoglycerate kinase [Pseudomonadota bacterium]
MNNINNINFTLIKNVILRVDYNVPINDNFIIQDFTRISRSQETIELLLKNNCKILLLTHFGRPDGLFDEKLSLNHISEQIGNNLGKKINFISYKDFITNGLSQYHEADNGIFLLDNIRFFSGEKKNDASFSKSITNGADIFINEAFSASHRSHASVDQMAKDINSCAGINFYKEVEVINSIKKSTGKNFAIIGGSKVSTKIDTLLSLVKSCSDIFIGGAMANNFLKFQKINVSNSLIEENIESKVSLILNDAIKYNCKIHLPEDVILDNGEEYSTQELNTKKDFKIFDIGTNTINVIKNITYQSDLILWNGPLGLIENEKFAQGSIDIAKNLSSSSSKVIVGGGDTILALNIAKQDFNNFYFVSTAGGAFLEALEDKILPGIKALTIQ